MNTYATYGSARYEGRLSNEKGPLGHFSGHDLYGFTAIGGYFGIIRKIRACFFANKTWIMSRKQASGAISGPDGGGSSASILP